MVANGTITHRVDMVCIVVPVVVEIVASSSHHGCNRVNMVQLSHFNQISLGKLEENHLHHICAMDVIMVLNLALVPLLNLL